MKVAILNYEGVVPTSVTGPYDMLVSVSGIAQSLKVPVKTSFEVDIVNVSAAISSKEFNVVGNKHISDAKKYDLVIIPAMNFNCIDQIVQKQTEMINWIKEQYQHGSDIAAICFGTFLLASSGLLDGKRATTHWMGAPYFRRLFPKIKLENDKVIIDEDRIYTCGAAYSFTSLMIYLIEKFCGREIALATAKVFMIQIHDTGQNAFSIFNIQHHHEDKIINDVQIHIEKNYNSWLNVAE